MTAASTAAPVALRPSAAGIALVKSFEACRLTAYLPTPKDRPTIGWGAAGPDVRLGMCWTQAQCDARFVSDLDACAADVCRELGAVATTQGQFDAIVSLAYNIGIPALRTSTLLRLHKAGDHAKAAAQFPRWNRQAGAVLAGLTRRRLAEQALYLSSSKETPCPTCHN
jgi:lysozyme